MTEKRRILSTQRMANELAMERKDFLALRKSPGFPKPVRGTKHHLWWDSVAINKYFDKLSNIQPESPAWKQRYLEAMSGDDNRAIP